MTDSRPPDRPVDIGLWSGFTRRLVAVLLGGGFLVGGLLTAVSIWKQNSQWETFLLQRGGTLTRSLARAASVPLLQEDSPALESVTQWFSEESNVSYVAVYTRDGKVIFQRPRERSLPLDSLPAYWAQRRVVQKGRPAEWDFVMPVRSSAGVRATDVSGYVRVGLTEEPLRGEVRAVVRNNLLLSLGIMSAAFGLGALLIQRMTRRMRNFIEQVRMAEALRESEEQIRSLNLSLQERAAQLEVSNNELEAFSYSVSHDLRAPLRSIDGFSQVLLEDEAPRLSGSGRKILERVRAATQRMAELIDDMLNLSRLARQEMRREKVDLTAMAREVLGELRGAEPARRVETAVAPALTAEGDGQLLRAVLENLIGNAWKFTSKTASPRIEVGFRPDAGGMGAFFVKDNGAGFNMAYAHKLFGVFERLHPAEEFTGTGVGLATVQRVIHRHGGRVWGESKPGEGAVFYFTL